MLRTQKFARLRPAVRGFGGFRPWGSTFILATLLIIVALVSPGLVWAKNPTVSLKIPAIVKANENFILRINLNHPGQSAKDYLEQIKLSSGSEPLRIWNYTQSTRSLEAKWQEKINLALSENTTLIVEVKTSLGETAKTEEVVTVQGATTNQSTDQAATTELNQGTKENAKNLDFTFWIFVVVVIVVLGGVVIYFRRKKKGLL